MKLSLPGMTAILAAALALGACAAHQPREEPHHYSKDRGGNRIACYATDVANEYDCLPARARYPHGYAYDPFYYDPFWPYWSLGFYYGGPHYYVGSVWYPPPPPLPPHRWHRRP